MLVVYLGHGILHPVVAMFILLKFCSARGSKLPNEGTSEKTWRSSIVALVKTEKLNTTKEHRGRSREGPRDTAKKLSRLK